MVRKGGRNVIPSDDLVLSAGDAIMVVGDRAKHWGGGIPDRDTGAREHREGSLCARLHQGLCRQGEYGGNPARKPTFAEKLSHASAARSALDADIVPAPDMTLEFGDRVGVLTPPERKEEIRQLFGDSVKAAAEFSYVSLGIGMALGVLLGLIPIPIPGVGVVTLGIGGGPLIVALIVGKLRRTGPLLWVMPLPANIVLRNFGLAMFLASVGINAGQPFVRTISETGVSLLLIGAVVLLTTVLIVLLVGYYLLKIPYDDLVGVASGATGNPAILVYSTRMAPTDRPDIGYAMIFPSMTIVKVIAVQIVGLLVAAGSG